MQANPIFSTYGLIEFILPPFKQRIPLGILSFALEFFQFGKFILVFDVEADYSGMPNAKLLQEGKSILTLSP